MQLKRHDLLPLLGFFTLLLLVVFVFLALAQQSVEVRVYDAHTGNLLHHAVVENLTPAQRRDLPTGWLFLNVDRQLSVQANAAGYLPTQASWHPPYPWTLQGHLDIPLYPSQLTGLVCDAETGQHLPGAEVWAGAQRVVTDASGLFQLSALAEDVSANVQLDGYQPWRGEFSWQSPSFQGELLRIELQPNLVTGQVYWRETGEPLAGVMVQAVGQQQVADDWGRFSLRRLRRGDIIAVERDGFWPAEVEYTGQSVKLELTPNVLEGRVSWQETDEALSEARVATGALQHITDEAGRFRLTPLRVGDIVTVEREGFWPAEMVFTGQSSEIEVVMQDRRAQVTIRSALEEVTLSGLEVVRGGQPIKATSSANFDLRVCKEGELLEVRAEGHWPSQISLGLSNDLAVGQVEEVEATLEPRALTVTVHDAYSDWPLAGARVRSSPIHLTDAAGQVTLAPATTGMTISVGYPGYMSQTLPYDGQSGQLEVRLVPETIQGTVMDAITGEPVPGAAIRRNGQTLARAAADGSFSLESGTGQPAFSVKVPGYRLTKVVIGDSSSPVLPSYCSDDASSGPPCWQIKVSPFEAKGVYIPFGLLSLRDRVLAILDMVTDTELNAVVVDIKGDWGWLAYDSALPLAKELGVSVKGGMDLHEFLDICHQRDIYAIARLVVFKDNPLTKGKEDWAVKKADGTVWLDRENLGWANPHNEKVWDYNIGIAKEVAQLGFDEIQVDYVRFPSDGDLSQIVYEEEDSLETRTTAIRTFVARLREALEPYDVFLSADVFGMTLTVDSQNDMGIGQRIIDIGPYVDYLCPMVYPSTWPPGSLGLANPHLHPYEVVTESLRRGMAVVSTRVRPWLQAYSLYGVVYGLERQGAQRQAAEKIGACGWTYWNAGGSYDRQLFRPAANDAGQDSASQGEPEK
jgi:hypothetical protein